MPYKAGQIPSGTESVPKHGQAIYRAAFNSAHSGGATEASAHAIAWAAVKNKYRKKGDRWVSKDGAAVMRAWDREFSAEERKSAAESGAAMPDGSYPIKSKSDLSNAMQALGRAKNRSATIAHIRKRAKALGVDLPEGWPSTNDARRLCPDCGGDGEDDDGNECETCDGTGYIDDDEDDDDDTYDGASKSVQLTDHFVMDGVRRMANGSMVANARISRTGIQLYNGDELGMPHMDVVRVYRPPEEVFSKRSMRSLAGIPITLNHPASMVDTSNWKDHAVGETGDEVARDGEYIRVPMMIRDAKAIEAYEKHGVRELSVGYTTDLKWGRGVTPDGEAYDAKQTAIRGNHLAVVPAARGGSRLRIGDDDQQGDSEMVKILIDGQTVDFTDALAAKHVENHISSLLKKIADANGKADKEAAEKEQEEEKRVRAEKDAATKDGEIAVLKKQLEDAVAKSSGKALDALVKARTELMLKANAAMDGKVNFDGKEPVEIHRMVVAQHYGEDFAKSLSDEAIGGAFMAITAKLPSNNGVNRLADNLSLLQHGGGSNPSPKAIKDAAYGEYVNNLSNAWRTPVRQQQ